MSGLGLTNALHEFQQGVAWNDQQKQQAVENKQRQTIQQANDVGAKALQQAHEDDVAQQQKAWTDGGNDPSAFQPKPFQMTPQILLAGMHARSDAIANSGDLDLWTRNEAATSPIRNQIRQQVIGKALADYNATGDGAALAQTVYPTIHDGVDIQSVTADPTGGLGMQGASTAAASGQQVKPAYKITLSNGQSHVLTGDQISSMAHDAMMNPADTAKFEFESRLNAVKMAQEAAKEKSKAQAVGDEARKTEGVKHQGNVEIEGLRSASAQTVAAGNNKATLGAAQISADGRVEAAGLRGSGAGGVDGAKKVQKTLVDSDGYVVNVFKDGSMSRATVSGQPVRSGDYAKRVDAWVKNARNTPGNMSKSEGELRAAAAQAFAPTAAAPAPGPSASGAGGAKDYSGLWAPGAN